MIEALINLGKCVVTHLDSKSQLYIKIEKNKPFDFCF